MNRAVMERNCLETTPGRLTIESFLGGHATPKLTLEIGTEDNRSREFFPNRIAINIRGNPSVNVQADTYQLPFSSSSFEVVLCTEVLEHLHTPAGALREIHRVLKPGGKLLLTTPFAYPIHYAPTDYYRYTRFGLEHLLREWQVESMTETTTDGAMLATYFHYWLFKKKGLAWKIPKLAWWFWWRLLTRQYETSAKRPQPDGSSNMPTGYMVVAWKRLENQAPENGDRS